jgi:hypothetical protein
MDRSCREENDAAEEEDAEKWNRANSSINTEQITQSGKVRNKAKVCIVESALWKVPLS